jgi:predicted CXXCH cytochrome family protein
MPIPVRQFCRRWLPGAMGVLVWLALLVGCATPQERYRVLSFFFDGVPDPSAPQKVVPQANLDANQEVVSTVAVMSRHKPYVTNQCAVCHESAEGIIMDFEKAYNQCVKCHDKVKSGHPLMHGPVVQDACKWCHTPHESAEPALLKDTPIVVCTQCHNRQLLGDKPVEHLDGKTSCLKCHFGHGGDARYFLKSAATTTAPAADEPSGLNPSPGGAP